MKKLLFLGVPLLALVIAGGVPSVYAADTGTERYNPYEQNERYDPFERTERPPAGYDTRRPAYDPRPLRQPDTPWEAGSGIPGQQDEFTAGCCQPPGPDGLHCCDTRDCGWFECDDFMMPEKVYR